MCRLHAPHAIVLIIAKIRPRENVRDFRVTFKVLLAIEEAVLIVLRQEGAKASSLRFENEGTGAFAVFVCERMKNI